MKRGPLTRCNVGKIDVKGRLKNCEMSASDELEVLDRVMVASHEKMLSVVDNVPRRFVLERTRSSAEVLIPLYQRYVPAGEREANGGGKTGNTRADNDNVRICHSHKMSKSNVKKQAEDE